MSKGINPYTCFCLNPKNAIDWNQLDKIYYAMQQAVHPDQFATHPLTVKAAAAQQSAAINDAYRRLKDPIERLWAIIEASGYHAERKSNIDNHPDIIADVFALQDEKADLSSDTELQKFVYYLQTLIDIAEDEFMALVAAQSYDQSIIKIYWMTYLHKLITDTNK